MNYESFVANKLLIVPPSGMDDEDISMPRGLFPHQEDIVRWALRRGRCAVFADTGLGKTRIELAYADNVCEVVDYVLILAPLAVAPQTVAEGAAMGIHVHEVKDGAEVVEPGIYITNYERLHRFDPAKFGCIILDESSIIKHHDSKTLATLLDAFRSTPWKLAATATPAPNDYTELGTHAEFLGICSRAEMLAEFFTHDGGETQVWRLKGHAVDVYWRWVASWAALIRRPSDLGHDDAGYDLPPLTIEHVVIPASQEDRQNAGQLFAPLAESLMDRRRIRRDSVGERVAAAVGLVATKPGPWLIWCELNNESVSIHRSIEGSIEVTGSMPIDEKEHKLGMFGRGQAPVLVTKPSIAGFGLNWQHCRQIVFVGVTDSWESYYQAIRRCWRFGQSQPVTVWVISHESEGAVVANLMRKDADARELAEQLSAMTREIVRSNIVGASRESNAYDPQIPMEVPSWVTA